MHLGLLERGVPESSRELVAKTRAEVSAALEELRDLAHGLHPTVLTDHGLAAAVSSLTGQSPLPVVTELRVERRLDPSREVAAYYVVSEALANAVKHAKASQLTVRVLDDRDVLTVEVLDDGVGGATPDGFGLRGLADRVEALGGNLRLTSAPGTGTAVLATLPAS